MTDTSISASKTAVQEAAARDILEDYRTYRREALSSDDPDDVRKLVEMQIKLIGAEPDKKAGLNDHLPTFNFIFHQGGVQATLQSVEVVENKPEALPPPTPPDTVELDLDGLLSGIDDKLQAT